MRWWWRLKMLFCDHEWVHLDNMRLAGCEKCGKIVGPDGIKPHSGGSNH